MKEIGELVKNLLCLDKQSTFGMNVCEVLKLRFYLIQA